MKTLVIGLLVGAVSTWGVLTYVVDSDSGAARNHREQTASADDQRPEATAPSGEGDELESLRARIRELEDALAKASKTGDGFDDADLPKTEEELRLLESEVFKGDDLDSLILLIRALLLQGEPAYPRLTRVLMQAFGKVASGAYHEDDFLERVVPLLRLGLHHEKELVGYVGYLLEADNVPGPFRTGAMAAAMFLAINRVPGAEAFAPRLMESFLQGDSQDREQKRMLIMAMGMLGQEGAVDPLLAMLDDPQQTNMQGAVIEALGRIGDPRVVPKLDARLRGGGGADRWQDMSVLTALARIGTPEAASVAERYLATVTDDRMFFYGAGSYLQESGSAAAVRMIRERFRASPGADSMYYALSGLQAAGTPEAIATLQEIATAATNTNMRAQAQRLLDERAEFAVPPPTADR